MRRKQYLLAVLSFIFSLSLFLYTTADGLATASDSSEFAVSILTNGIPHPSGYPLFVVLGKIAILLPLSNKLFLINALSALFGALTVVFLSLLLYILTESFISSLFTGALLSTSALFWKYSSVSEIFTLNTFFAMLLTFLSLTIKTRRGFLLLCFMAGLSLSNHPIILFIFPVLIFLLWKRKVLLSLKDNIAGALLALAGLTPYLYLLWAGVRHPLQNWENPDNLAGVIDIMTRKSYGAFHLAANEIPTSSITRQALDYITASSHQFTPVGLLLFLVGVIIFIKANKIIALSFLFTFIFSGIFFVIFAKAPVGDPLYISITERFLLLPNLFLLIFVGVGLNFLLKLGRLLKGSKYILNAIYISIFILPVFLAITNFAIVNQRGNRFTEDLADDIFTDAPKGALLLVAGDQTTQSVLYSYVFLKKRQDLAIISAYHIDREDHGWYIPVAKQYFPDVLFPDYGNYSYSEYMSIFIDENLKKRPVVCACGFLKERLKFPNKSKSIGIIEEFLPNNQQTINLSDLQKEIDQNIKIYKNTNNIRSFTRGSMENNILGEYYSTPYIKLATIYAGLGNLDEAEKLYKKSLEFSDLNYRAYLLLTLVYEQKGNYSEAQKVLERYLQLNPSDSNADEIKKHISKLKTLHS